VGIHVPSVAEPGETEAPGLAPEVHVIGFHTQEWKRPDTHEGLPGCVVQVKVTSGAENVVYPGLGDASPDIGVR